MPSPFPGMDPYIEGSSCWRDFHSRFLATTSDMLGPRLRPRYVVRVEERAYLSGEDDPGHRHVVPDVSIVATPGAGWDAGGGGGGGAGVETEVAEAVEVTREFPDDEVRDKFLQVIDVADRAVVTVIELLSPTNKLPGSRGRAEYEAKRTLFLAAGVHLVEVDLLRDGRLDVDARDVRPHDYSVFLSRAVGDRRRSWVWPILLRQRLPVIPIPLRGPDPDVPLDLQAVVASVYDRGSYDLDLDYRRPPAVHLHRPAEAWADALLRSMGLRDPRA